MNLVVFLIEVKMSDQYGMVISADKFSETTLNLLT